MNRLSPCVEVCVSATPHLTPGGSLEKFASCVHLTLLITPMSTPALIQLQDSDGPPRPEGVHPPVFSALRHSRVVSSTSEEEEALTEKFLKINCKYITDGKVSSKDALI